MTAARLASLSTETSSGPVLRRPPTLRHALLAIIGAAFTLGLAGYLIAILWPSPHEFVAFVHGGSLEKEEVSPRPDVLDKVNGLSHASEVAQRLNRSPWTVWRKYTVTAEGPVYVVRVYDTDPVRGEELVRVVRDTLVVNLKQRYDAALAPRRGYIAALEAEVVRLSDETSKLATVTARLDANSLRAVADRWVALANIRERLRDEQVFVALSEAPSGRDEVRRRDPDRRGRQVLLTLTGVVVGLAAGAAYFIFVAFRTRSAHAFAGA